MDVRFPALLGFLLALSGAAPAATTSNVVDLPVAGGTQRFLYVKPDVPIANIVHLPGGDGILGIQADGSMNTVVANCSPIGRNRAAFAGRGMAIALVDANSAGVVRNIDDVVAVARYMQARHDVPTWIIGGSASTGAVGGVGMALPASDRVGLVWYSPARENASFLARIRRPTLVVYHSADPDQFGNTMYNALTGAVVRERIALNAGTNQGCGFHLFNGQDAEFVAAVAGFIERNNAATRLAAANFQGLWWRSPAGSEPGWGVNLTHQGDILFATWFTYDAEGRGMWLVMSNGAKTAENTYSGALYRTTGPAFNSATFDSSRVVATEVGAATFTFTDASNGTFAYTVNGISQSKPITRQVYSAPVPECAAGGAEGATPNYQALWWAAPAGSESGWGVNITHQGDILFATWFTYDADGRGLWLAMSEGVRTGQNTYSGVLFRTSGPAFDASWIPGPIVVRATSVGTATFTFANSGSGTFAYTVDGVAGTKQITRQVYSTPVTVCR